MSIKLLRYLFYSFLFLTIYSYFVWFVLLSFSDPQFNRFEKYKELYNWNQKQHAIDDFDGDGKDDLVDFRGCGFFSSLDINKVPQQQRCIAPIMTKIYLKNQDLIGQKIYQLPVSNLEAENIRNYTKLPVSHSFLFKKHNESWKIFVNSRKLEIFEIRKDGLLQKMKNVPVEFKLDEALYMISELSFIPLYSFSYLFSFVPYFPGWSFFLIISPTVTIIFYFLSKKNNRHL